MEHGSQRALATGFDCVIRPLVAACSGGGRQARWRHVQNYYWWLFTRLHGFTNVSPALQGAVASRRSHWSQRHPCIRQGSRTTLQGGYAKGAANTTLYILGLERCLFQVSHRWVLQRANQEDLRAVREWWLEVKLLLPVRAWSRSQPQLAGDCPP